MLQFTSVGRKDTLRNVEATGEFTVSLATYELRETINATATDFPAGISEFDACGVAARGVRGGPPPAGRGLACGLRVRARGHAVLRAVRRSSSVGSCTSRSTSR